MTQTTSQILKTVPDASKPLIMLHLFIPVFHIAHNSLTDCDLVSGCLMPYLDMCLWRFPSHSLFSSLKHATFNGCVAKSVTVGVISV